MRALEKDRTKRFANAPDFLEALDEAELQEPGLVALARRVSDGWPAAAAHARTKLKSQIAWLKAEPRRMRTAASVGAVVLGLSLVTPLFTRDKGHDVSAPMKPKPVEPALVTPIKRAEEAIARGELTKARATLLQQLSEHPDSGRVRYLLGTIDFLEKRPAEGLNAYTDALGYDPGLRSDAALLLNVRGLLDDKRLARQALDLMIDKIGRPAAEPIADVATDDKRGDFRRAARDGCARLGCLERVDLVKSFGLDLTQAKNCEEKRQAVKGLATTKDTRAVEVLRKARKERGGPLGGLFGAGNDCIRKDIDAALEALGAAKG
jgi:tetratricopeptide (TPR) repeat protein